MKLMEKDVADKCLSELADYFKTRLALNERVRQWQKMPVECRCGKVVSK